MKFKKIYIEITNSCNFNCSFCFTTSRTTKFMSVDDFRTICERIRPFTNYIYLHVLGEPLLHPHIEDFLQIAQQAGLNVNITTNGGLLERKKDILLKYPIRQINFSLHDAEENIQPENLTAYLQSILDFSKMASNQTYICLRLWNTSSATSHHFNQQILNQISSFFNISAPDLETTTGNGIKLADHIFLQKSPRFEWPDEKLEAKVENRYCYALRDHIAILADGTIVPCCLDADGSMKLGNIFTDNLKDVLQSSKALNIKKGFEQRKVVEPLCATCGFTVE